MAAASSIELAIEHHKSALQAGQEKQDEHHTFTGDPWSTTGSSADRSPRLAAQLLLLPAARVHVVVDRKLLCAASKMWPTLKSRNAR